MSERKKLIEGGEHAVYHEWYRKAKGITPFGEITTFILHLAHDYEHTHDSVIHAITAAAIASATLTMRESNYRISGYQAEAVAHEFKKHWVK